MTVTERVMAAGSWDVALVPETPRRLLEAIDVELAGYAVLVVTPTHLDPRIHTDATMLACAKYSGVYRKQPSDHQLSGVGLPILLGDEDGKGDVYENARETANGWLTEWVTSLRPMSLAAGTTYNPGGSYDGSFRFVTAKEAFKTICDHFSVEWRITPDFKLHVGSPSSLYGAVPQLIALHRAGDGGRDFARLPSGAMGPMVGVTTTKTGMSRDLEDYTTKIVYVTTEEVATDTEVVTEQGEATYTWDANLGSDVVTDIGNPTTDTVTERETVTHVTTAATAEASIIYRRPADDGPMILDRYIDGQTEDGTSPQTIANQQLARFASIHRELSVDGGTADISHVAPVGSPVYIYGPPVVADPANTVWFRGQQINPILTRLMGATWPIRRGNGVYLRKSAGSGVFAWHDLTPYVQWEDGAISLEVDAMPRPSR